MVRVNSSGTFWGKMISARNLAAGASATGLQGKEGVLSSLVLGWYVGPKTVMAIIVTLRAYVLPFVVPWAARRPAT